MWLCPRGLTVACTVNFAATVWLWHRLPPSPAWSMVVFYESGVSRKNFSDAGGLELLHRPPAPDLTRKPRNAT